MRTLRMRVIARLGNLKQRGASAVEYGLLIAGIAAVIVVAVMALGPVVSDKFSDTCSGINKGACSTTSSSN